MLSGTEAPSQQWDEWFNKEVEKFEKNRAGSKTTLMSYRIPVVFHIIHFGQAVGTFPNIDSNLVKSQVAILNQDYAGTGLNYTNVPQYFSNLMTNTGISFCLARLDPSNAVMTEKGIHRVNANSYGWPNASTPTVNLVNYVNNLVKPNTIWDPTKYLNIWVTDRSPSTTILGFATYPAGTTLNGLPNSGGTLNNDGVWCYAGAVGDLGASSTVFYNKGRTLTREIAHWLGVRSIWGDGNCLDDYCSDTPWAKQANTGYPIRPSFVNRCGPNQSPNGEMTMNFMDFTDDTCRYMFTPSQATRMQIAMGQGTYRNALGTHNICLPASITSASATAGFYFDQALCSGRPITPVNTSTGGPMPSFQWSSSPALNIYPVISVASPAITFPTPGTYTIYLTATNTVNIATYSLVVTSFTCPADPLCLDTIRRIKPVDTLTTYKAPHSTFIPGCQTGNSGFLTGTNCYTDKEFAQYIPPTSYTTIPYPQINSVLVLFDSAGTKTPPGPVGPLIACKIYGGTVAQGPNAQIVTKSDSLKKIVRTPKTKNVKYCGTPTYTLTTAKIIPYKFDFASPVILTNSSNGFYAAIEMPFQSPGDSVHIFCNTITSASNDSTSWLLQNVTNVWRTLRYNRGAKVQLAIMPQITCRPVVGIEEIKSEFSANVALMPNPNNGVFSLIFTLPREEKLTITTFNTLGQKITNDQLENVGHNMINMDLSSRPDGIYFIHISNGTEKIVKRVVLTH